MKVPLSVLLRSMAAVSMACVLSMAAANDSHAAPDPDTFSIDGLVAEVVRKNPELDFYRAEIAVAKAGRRTAREWKNPELTASLGSKRVWDRGGPALGDGAAWSVSVSQVIEWPGRIALRKAIANQQVELAQIGLGQFEAVIAARAKTLGFAALAASEKADATREVAERFKSLLAVLVQRDPAGITPLLDQRIIEANAIALHRRVTQAEQELQTAILELNQLRGSPASAPLKVVGNLGPPNSPPPLDVLLAVAFTNNFDLRIRRAELAQQGFRVDLARHERKPAVTIAPFYSEERANDEQRIFGVELSVPLPVWNRNEGAIETAQARLEQAEASWRAAQRVVEREVANHALALRTQLEEMASWRQDAQTEFRDAAALADRHYRLGAVPVTTYVEMQMKYLDALEALLATRLEAHEHSQQLELLVGCKLDQISRHAPSSN
ncbi:MAG: TolC family protein [Verrucomicrobia bacterium]|nr:TolC family protein [Verrucomicrobiota bacterium]